MCFCEHRDVYAESRNVKCLRASSWAATDVTESCLAPSDLCDHVTQAGLQPCYTGHVAEKLSKSDVPSVRTACFV